DSQGNPYLDRTITYTTGKSGKSYFFNPPLTVTTASCDGSACGTAKSRTTTYTYDEYDAVYGDQEYGNATTEVHSGTSTTARTVARTFKPNPAAWIVNLPATEQIKDAATVKAKTSFYYDGVADCGTAAASSQPTKGDVTRIVTGVDQEPQVEVRLGYDTNWGTLKCRRDGKCNQSDFYFGASDFTQLSKVTAYPNYPSLSGKLETNY